uniref:Protein OSCP1 n=1 Tax=Wuchereria bancrofti TaxID=6293 RepID=A0A1I8EFT5_WUCBA
MSLKCMPLLLLNMGSEMIYILQQRLKAQNVDKVRMTQVLRDISHILFNTIFLKELFKPQYVCSKQIMRLFFEKIIHSTIMRLNEMSMDKLYALMTMTYKYQLQLCNGPENIVFITLNHFDCVREILRDDEKLNQFLDVAHRMDLRVNISLFVRENKQTDEGYFILFPETNYQLPYNGKPPGMIKYFESNGKIRSESFVTDDDVISYKPCNTKGSTELNKNDRGTTLGCNMYVSPETLQVKSDGIIMKSEKSLPDDELQLLSALIISPEQNQQKGFELNLFTDEMEEKTFVQEYNKTITAITHIDARMHRKTLTAAVADLKMEIPLRESKKGEDMLNLLDEAANPITSTVVDNDGVPKSLAQTRKRCSRINEQSNCKHLIFFLKNFFD